jgi:2-hydroxy-3-oxopropionate reductase
MKIGFIGLGIMGKPMVRNLVSAGYEVLVWNRSQKALEEAAAGGAVPSDKKQIGEEADIIFTMLPNSPQVKEVILGTDGLLPHMHEGQILVDCSSINPVASQEICRALSEKGIHMLDAPVSGGEPKAIDGTLSFMVGGRKEIFDKCKDILLCMGASAVLCGDVGAGNTTKLANQIIVACNIQALAEALTLAQKAGVDPELVFQAIKGGLAGSTVMNAKAPMMIAGDNKPGFKIDLHIKDLNNALDCAHSVGAPVPMTAAVQEVMQWMHSHDGGQKDHSAIAEYYEHLSDITIGRTKE